MTSTRTTTQHDKPADPTDEIRAAPRLLERWGLADPQLLADTFSSRLWKVCLPDGTPAVIKDLKPIDDIADELRGGDYLAWRQGVAAVRLLDRDGYSMLLEHAGERMLAHEVSETGDDHATLIAAELMAELYSPSATPFPSELQPIRQRFAALFERADSDRATGICSAYVEAAVLADRLFDDTRRIRGLHGDLHHENIMLSPRGWLVIDPVGIVGDIGFGAANMFYDPADRDDLCLDPRRTAFMAEAFRKTLQEDPRRLLDQAYAYGCLSAAWNAGADDREGEERDLAIAAVIGQVRDDDF
ncbi:hypothetical protein HT585_25685 [Ensifer sp. HO-A22]|uniref:Uncharacterized protein n=1 Tax=Ensifer oleiphilus TaxID=2742698 RepID=A0A7Y6QAW2_9HYPH|nr:aminoglycoside phosphotransferase family protein [Ensifer oleiphilus]NVD42268.1 hypothetical protein [Ensifer oleiphilus]